MNRSDIIRILEYTLGIANNGGKKEDIHGSLLTLINRLQSQPNKQAEKNFGGGVDVIDYFNNSIFGGKS